jgi:hypothetical protein
LAGTNYGIIRSSYSQADVTGYWSIGGLVGYNAGKISQSHATGSVQIAEGRCEFAGGLTADNEGGEIASSYSTGAVISGDGTCVASGGLVSLNNGTISLSHSESQTANSGLVLYNDGPISQSYALGPGLVGINYSNGNIVQCYSTGSQSSETSYLGGLVDYNYEGTITQSYSTGSIPASPNNGGFVGFDRHETGGGIAGSYWDLDTSGINDPAHGAGNIQNDPGITGISDAQLRSGLPGGFDPKVWAQNPNVNGGYPYLITNPPPQ